MEDLTSAILKEYIVKCKTSSLKKTPVRTKDKTTTPKNKFEVLLHDDVNVEILKKTTGEIFHFYPVTDDIYILNKKTNKCKLDITSTTSSEDYWRAFSSFFSYMNDEKINTMTRSIGIISKDSVNELRCFIKAFHSNLLLKEGLVGINLFNGTPVNDYVYLFKAYEVLSDEAKDFLVFFNTKIDYLNNVDVSKYNLDCLELIYGLYKWDKSLAICFLTNYIQSSMIKIVGSNWDFGMKQCVNVIQMIDKLLDHQYPKYLNYLFFDLYKQGIEIFSYDILNIYNNYLEDYIHYFKRAPLGEERYPMDFKSKALYLSNLKDLDKSVKRNFEKILSNSKEILSYVKSISELAIDTIEDEDTLLSLINQCINCSSFLLNKENYKEFGFFSVKKDSTTIGLLFFKTILDFNAETRKMIYHFKFMMFYNKDCIISNELKQKVEEFIQDANKISIDF